MRRHAHLLRPANGLLLVGWQEEKTALLSALSTRTGGLIEESVLKLEQTAALAAGAALSRGQVQAGAVVAGACTCIVDHHRGERAATALAASRRTVDLLVDAAVVARRRGEQRSSSGGGGVGRRQCGGDGEAAGVVVRVQPDEEVARRGGAAARHRGRDRAQSAEVAGGVAEKEVGARAGAVG